MFGLGQGFEVYDDDFASGDTGATGHLRERPAMDTVAAARRWLSTIGSDEAFFAWVHLFDPHAPLQAPEPFASRFPDDAYQAEISYADAAVGELLAALEDVGRAASTLVAVTSDHGEGLGERGEEGHAILLYDGTLRVPMLIAGPGVRAGVVRAPVSLVDLAPTLVELAGVDDDGAFSRHGGASLRVLVDGSGSGDDERELYFETYFPRLHHGWSELVGVARGEWKYVEAPGARDGEGRPRSELYRPASDPGERTDLAAAEPAVARELSDRLRDLRSRLAARALAAARRTVEERDLEELAALGYGGLDVEADDPWNDPEEGGGEAARDPRHVAEAVSYLNAVRALAASGDFATAEIALGRLSEIDPGGVAELEATGDLHLARGRARLDAEPDAGRADLARAAQAFGRAAEEKPGRRGLWVRRAESLLLLGRLRETLSCLDRAMELAPPGEALLRMRAEIERRLDGE